MISSYVQQQTHSKWYSRIILRVGGDEFVIIEQNIERDKYEERITALKNIMQDKQVSISIGVLWREYVDDLEELLKAADKLMYMEKEMYHNNRE